jgi:hypothetical protein
VEGTAPDFHISDGGICSENGAAAETLPDSASDAGSYARRSVAHSSAALTSSADSRNWYRNLPHQGSTSSVQHGVEERAEVELALPMSAVTAAETNALAYPYPLPLQCGLPGSDDEAACVGEQGGDVAGRLPPSLSRLSAHASSSAKTNVAEPGCGVATCVVKTSSINKSGKERLIEMLHVHIGFEGPHALKEVSLEGLRQLGVTVVYGVDEDELMEALSTCRQVGILE